MDAVVDLGFSVICLASFLCFAAFFYLLGEEIAHSNDD
jgi:hypothetical protein